MQKKPYHQDEERQEDECMKLLNDTFDCIKCYKKKKKTLSISQEYSENSLSSD